MAVTHSYFIATTARTGSSLLSEAMDFTRIAGAPREFFEPFFEDDFNKNLGITTLADYLPKFLAAGSTPNGVFGAKLMWHQFLHLQKKLRLIHGQQLTVLELLDRSFPDLRYIFLTRRDKVRQAVSYHRAIQTDFWHAIKPFGTEGQKAPPPAPPFDAERIDYWISRFRQDEMSWFRHFESLGIEPFEVVYEDFPQNYEATVLDLLRYLEIPIPKGLKIRPPRLQKLSDDETEAWVERYLQLKKSRTRAIRRTTRPAYFLCSTPRTGSFLLAEALESTGIAGRPREFFDPTFEKEWLKELNITSDSEYLDKILWAGTTPNGVFGAKVHWHQFGHLSAKLRSIQGYNWPDLEMLRETFPGLRYIFLTRRDKVRQAVSYYRAIQTRVWWSIRPDAIEGAIPPGEPAPLPPVPPFDFEQIDHWVNRLAFFEWKWRRHFEKAGVKPFEVVYEDFIESYELNVRAILRHLELPQSEAARIAPPRLQKQADEISEEWVRRYHQLRRPGRIIRRPAFPSYFISCTPRTGSTLLSEALESTQVVGRPKEYFDPGFEEFWWRELGISADNEYLDKILSAGTTLNGVFGAKVHWNQFQHLLKKLRQLHNNAMADLELLRGVFPSLRYVFLTRRDKLRQAISYCRAIQTGVWRRPRPDLRPNQEASEAPPIPAPEFDFEQIDHWVTRLTELESNWGRHFTKLGVEPFEVNYEEFVDAYEPTTYAVLGYLGTRINKGIKVAPPRTVKMADEVTEEWVARYRQLKGT